MSITEREYEQAAATVPGAGGSDGASAPQVARTRDGHDNAGSANETTAAPWSMRAGEGIRKGASATLSHPRTWGIWDQHPASLRAVCGRRADSACQHPSVLVRWPANAGWAFVIAWAAVFTLAAVAPRNKTCWILAAVAVIAWLTWRH